MSMIARTAVVLGVIVSGITSLAYTHPAQPTEQHPPSVEMPVEPVSATPKADRLELFDKRWGRLPTVAEIRTIPLERPEPPPPLPVRPEIEPEPDRHRQHHHVEQREQREERPANVCERHHLRKLTNGGRSWRCRR